VSKEQILEAAAQIFSHKGYHAASMQDIADAVELKKASLYHYFPKKQVILLNLLDRALDLVIQQVSEAFDNDASASEKLQLGDARACAALEYLSVVVGWLLVDINYGAIIHIILG